jgi:hypothetical protein
VTAAITACSAALAVQGAVHFRWALRGERTTFRMIRQVFGPASGLGDSGQYDAVVTWAAEALLAQQKWSRLDWSIDQR